MALYFVNAIITAFCGWLSTHVKKNQRTVIAIVTVLIPGLIAGLRVVGTDYFTFQERYNALEQDRFFYSDVSLIYVIMKLIIWFEGNYQQFIFIMSFAIVIAAFYLFWELKEYISVPMTVFSYMMLFYQMSFNYFKQIFSVELFLIALFLWLMKKNKIMSMIFVVLSVSIHLTTIVFVPLFFILPMIFDEKKKKVRLFIYVGLGVFVYMLPRLEQLTALALKNFSHFRYYFVNFNYSPIGLGVLRYLLLAIVPCCYLAVRRKSSQINEPDYIKVCSFLGIVGAILWMTTYVSTSTIYRIAYTGTIALPIIHGYIVKNLSGWKRSVVSAFLIVTLIFFWWYDFFYLGSCGTYPYESILK